MKIFKITSILIAFIAISFITSCEKDDPVTPDPVVISGCTDSTAVNYNSDATEDDGSCSYCVDNDSLVESNLGSMGISSCEAVIDYLITNYSYSESEACAWDGSPMMNFGGMTIGDYCECSCADVSPVDPVMPTTYDFSNASYGGQTDRLNMLKELETYLKTVNDGAVIDASIAKSMYSNDGYTWTSDAFASGQPTKQLKNKTFESEQSNVEALIDELADLSVNGTLTGSYMFNENGFEPVQLIVKGIMGSCFYYQGTSVYLSDLKMNVDNDVAALTNDTDYTDMQHHFDESFGYLGAPVDMSIANPDGGSYWGKYAKKTMGGGLTTIDDLMQDGFIAGRYAIDNMDYDARDLAIAKIQTEWEMIPVASALYYLNASEAAIADDAFRNHALSEAIAFMAALKFNSNGMVSSTQVDEMIAMLGDNLFNITASMIDDTRNALASAYGISNPTEF